MIFLTNGRETANSALFHIHTCDNCNAVLNVSKSLKIKNMEDTWQNALVYIHCQNFFLSQHGEYEPNSEEVHGLDDAVQGARIESGAPYCP